MFVPEGSAPPEGIVVAADGGQSATSDEYGAVRLIVPTGQRTFRITVPGAAPDVGPGEFRWPVGEVDVPSVIFRVAADGRLGPPDVESARKPEATTAEVAAAEPEEEELPVALGTMSGVVVSEEDETPVAGARIFVRGVNVEGITDAAGRFSMQVPVGEHACSVVHAKFSTQTSEVVNVQENRVVAITVRLSPASVQLDDFVVTAPFIQGGVAELVATRRDTTAVADVIGSEQMSKSGDTSAASALKRVTGLTLVGGKFVYVRGMGERYSSTLMNGLSLPSPEPERRVVPLDLFPASILQSVIVQKTYSPEMPGEFGGGSVQLRTRAIPEDFLFQINSSVGANSVTTFRDGLNYRGSSTDWLGFDDGRRALPDLIARAPSISGATQFTPEELEAFGDSFEPNYQVYRQTIPLDHSIGISIGDRFDIGVPAGAMASVFYRRSYNQRNSFLREVRNVTGTLAYEGNDFSIEQFSEEINTGGMVVLGIEPAKNQRIEANTLLLRMSELGASHLDGLNDDQGFLFRQEELDWVERQVFTQQILGEHAFSMSDDKAVAEAQPKLNWRYGYSLASRDQPDRRRYLASKGQTIYTLFSDAGSTERFFSELDEEMNEGGFDLQWPLFFGDNFRITPALGAQASVRTREVTGRRFQFDVSGAGSQASPGYSGQPPDQVLSRENIDPNGFVLLEATQDDPKVGGSDSYSSRLTVLAAYAKETATLFEDLDVMAGVRLEQALQTTRSYNQFDRDESVRAALDNFDWLPASTLTWRFIKDMQLRGGFGITVSRPDFREISTSKVNDIKLAINLRGNPELKRALIRNYDLRWEWYPSPDESFSIGGFYKDFERPIELVLLEGSGKIWTWRNSMAATNAGLEFEARKSLAFAGDWGRRLIAGGNVALIQSQIELQTTVENQASSDATNPKRALQGQSPYVINAQLEYDGVDDGAGFTSTLLYNVFGPRIALPGSGGAPDVVEAPFHRLDLVLSYRISHWNFGLKAQNLLDGRARFTQSLGDQELTRAAYRAGRDFSLNATWRY